MVPEFRKLQPGGSIGKFTGAHAAEAGVLAFQDIFARKSVVDVSRFAGNIIPDFRLGTAISPVEETGALGSSARQRDKFPKTYYGYLPYFV